MEVLIRTALTNVLSASMLAMAIAAAGLILSRRPAILHCLWLIVLVKLLAPPMLEVPLMNPRTAEPFLGAEAASLIIATAPTDPPAEARWVEPATAWGMLGVVWLVGSLITSGLAAVRVRRFQRVLVDAEPADAEIGREVAALAGRMGLRRPPEVLFIDGRLTPLLWAVGRPRLVIPRELWKDLDARSRTLLLTHELAHLKRGDHWLRLFELAVMIAYWWLPVVWWVRRALRDVEEQCCDAWVVWMFPDEARTYAETLLDTVDFLNPVAKAEPLLASGFGKVHHLRRRLTMVMLGTTPRTLGWSGTLGALALAGILLPMSPTWAKDAKPPTGAGPIASLTTADELLADSTTLLLADSSDHGRRHHGKTDDAKKDDGKREHGHGEHAKKDDGKREHGRGDDAKKDDGKREHGRGDHAKKDDGKREHGRGDHAKKDDGKREHGHGEHAKKDDGKREHGRGDHAKKDDGKREHGRGDHAKKDDGKRHEGHVEHAKHGDAKRDHAKGEHGGRDHGKQNDEK